MTATAEPYLPKVARASLSRLRRAAADCRGCELYRFATQTVFGRGRARASIVLVGEQPGDQEDVAGRPFVGPAGALLDKALADSGIARNDVYLTNAVKHFKWTPAPRGKRRLHAKPSSREIDACRPWLEAELEAIRPRVVVLLGASAARSLLGAAFRITKQRGRLLDGSPWSHTAVATFHPSAVLRAPSGPERKRRYRHLVSDLSLARQAARG